MCTSARAAVADGGGELAGQRIAERPAEIIRRAEAIGGALCQADREHEVDLYDGVPTI